MAGREAEYELLRIAIRGSVTPDGPSSLVLVEGDAGVGKTWLTDAVIGDLPGHPTVLRVVAAESETVIELGVIERLVADGGLDLGVMDPPWRTGRRPRAVEVGSSLLEWIRSRATTRPTLLVVDDAQWCDRASLEVLAYLARRLGGLSAGIVVLQRSPSAASDALERVAHTLEAPRVPLSVLAVGGLRRVLAANGTPVSRRTATRIHEHTGGNPSHALVLIRELGVERLSRGDADIPAPRSHRAVVGSVFADAAPEVRAVVAASAVLGEAAPLSAVTFVSGSADPMTAIDGAIESGLLARTTRAGTRLVDVTHPLVRSIVIDEIPLAYRAALHDRAATLTADPARRMLHRLAASTDPAVATEAIAVAHAMNSRGWDLTAAELLLRAADLLHPGPEREHALLTAAEIVLTNGEIRWAEAILDTVESDSARVGAARVHGDLEALVRGHLALLSGDGELGARLINLAWETRRAPEVAVRAAELLAIFASDVGDGGLTTMWASRALDAANDGASELRYASTMLATGWAMRGDLETGRERVAHHLESLAGSGSEADALLARGLLDTWDGRLDSAIETYRSFDGLVERAPAMVRMSARLSLADALYRRGDWDGSLAITESDIAELEEGWASLGAPLTLAMNAAVLAAQGRWDRAEARIARAESGLGPSNFTGRLWVAVARARLAAARGEASGVVDALIPVRAILDRTQLPEGYQPWRAELIEALVRLGRLEEAAEVLQVAESRIDYGGAHARIGIRRARGLLAAARGDTAAASAVFDVSPEEVGNHVGVFEGARFAHAAGAFERRRGRRRRAVECLEHAIAGFTHLGARPYATRTRGELALCATAKPAASRGLQLTPAEEGVARLVAAGGTNREIAEELAVSVKTIESHLTRIFTKLSVRHRVEMVSVWQRMHADHEGSRHEEPGRRER